MRTRPERERELQGMMCTAQGIQRIMETWQLKVLGSGKSGPIGMSASQMIPLILDHEFPRAPEAAVPHAAESIERAKAMEVQRDRAASSIAQRIAEAASAFEQRRTGRTPSAVTVVLSAEMLVITLEGALSRAEKDMAKTPEGAAKVQEFHRVLFATSCEPLRKEIEGITGVQIRQPDEASESAAVVSVFPAGAIVQVFLLSRKIPTESWSGKIPESK